MVPTEGHTLLESWLTTKSTAKLHKIVTSTRLKYIIKAFTSEKLSVIVGEVLPIVIFPSNLY